MTTHMKWTYGLSGFDYRIATLSKLNQIDIIGIIMPSFKMIGQF